MDEGWSGTGDVGQVCIFLLRRLKSARNGTRANQPRSLFSRYKMSSDQFTHRLVVPSVRLSDAGEYTAVAGSSMSRAHLGVEGRDVKISEPSDRNVSVSSHIPDGSHYTACWVTVLFTPTPLGLLGVGLQGTLPPHLTRAVTGSVRRNHPVVSGCSTAHPDLEDSRNPWVTFDRAEVPKRRQDLTD